MRSFEQNTADQDIRIMAVACFQHETEVFALFGLSSGVLEIHNINMKKRRLEIIQSGTVKFRGSVLSMKRLRFPGA
jgi:hypothetical protein